VTKGVEKRLVLGLAICLTVLFHSSGPANADDLQAEDILQPQGLRHAGVYTLQQMDPELTGAGVKFAVISRSFTYVNDEPQNDYRPNIDHRCFTDTQFTFYDQGNLPAGVSPHSTSICSILLGEDPAAYNPEIGQFNYRGAAPQAQAGIYEFWYFLSNDVFNHTPPDADIISVGIGSPFEDWWTRGIESLVEHYGVTVVAGIGNGADSRHPVLYPGAAANVIGVGVVDSVNIQDAATKLANFALAYPEHSSYGPTSSGQSKPDIVAPGNCLAAEANEPNQYEPTGDWSSFATPIVAGTAGLLVQKARLDPGLSLATSPSGGNCVIKAILLNSATKLPYWHKGQLQIDDDHFVPLDYIQGAGMLNAVSAYEHLVAGLNGPGEVAAIGWDLNSLDKSETRQNVYRIALPETTDKYITATVVWNRHYSRSYPFAPLPEKDINLRLELWTVDPANPGNNYLLDYSDSSADNIEHIHVVADPGYSNYEVIISLSNMEAETKADLSQRYGLAWSVSDKQDADSIFWYDLNADGIVNEADYIIALNNLTNSVKSPGSYLLGDINPDGAIDAQDLQVLLSHKDRQADWRTKQEHKSQ